MIILLNKLSGKYLAQGDKQRARKLFKLYSILKTLNKEAYVKIQ